MFNNVLASLALVLSAAAQPVAAQESTIVLESKVLLLQATEDGTELVEASRVVPGDELELVTEYANKTGQQVTDFVIKTPVPANVTVDSGSLSGIEASVDGGTEWGELAQLTVTDADGSQRPANAGDVTHLRWILAELGPDASGSVKYRAVVK